ncbi:DUF4221 family protein [Belliella aquatica]|uniref:6-bladed beta-propeller protein n=1 Tax=Belliella aquatica TaxID=1323734 RepID=A0ABQ1M2Y8_9BACT|nr:DUF4221 family protein [Belliella aquatica]MCH7404829.1 DUF4221 domain-containing protein [Belliella aquatica]GGC33862.1 hypothetical protein GCM10010993_10880 [Belliella aquatica]
MKFESLSVLVCFLFFSSCSNNEDKRLVPLKFKKIGTISLKLDDETSGKSSYYDLVEMEEDVFLAFLNKTNNSVYFYNLKNQELEKKIYFEKTGPNGVNEVTGFLIQSEDSIFVYSYNGRRISLLNKNLEVINRYSIISDEREVNPQVNSLRKIHKVDNILILNSWGSQREYYKNHDFPNSILTFLDLENNKLSYDVTYPKKYTEGIWGTQLYQVYHDFNTMNNELILNFPIDDKIYIYDFENKLLKSEKVKNDIPLLINPLSKSQEKISIDLLSELKIIKSQKTYYFIRFINELEIYIRIINKEISEEDLNSGDLSKISFGESTLQFINKDFELISEVHLDKSYFLPSLFYNNGNIYIEKFQSDNEDILNFDVFNFSIMPN